MPMNPRDAAIAKGCIDSMISFAKAKLRPHVAEIRSIQSQHLVGRRPGQKTLQYINAVPALAKQSLRSRRNLVRMPAFHPAKPTPSSLANDALGANCDMAVAKMKRYVIRHTKSASMTARVRSARPHPRAGPGMA